MKINRQINECYCANCRKYEECRAKGVFDEDPGFDFCVNYEDVSYPDDDNDEKAIEAFKSYCVYKDGCGDAGRACDLALCEDLRLFIQKLNEE